MGAEAAKFNFNQKKWMKTGYFGRKSTQYFNAHSGAAGITEKWCMRMLTGLFIKDT